MKYCEGPRGGAALGVDKVYLLVCGVFVGRRLDVPDQWGFGNGNGVAIPVDQMVAKQVWTANKLREAKVQASGKWHDLGAVDGSIGILNRAENGGAAWIEKGGILVLESGVRVALAEELEFHGRKLRRVSGTRNYLRAMRCKLELELHMARGDREKGFIPSAQIVVPGFNLPDGIGFGGEFLEERGIDRLGNGVGQ